MAKSIIARSIGTPIVIVPDNKDLYVRPRNADLGRLYATTIAQANWWISCKEQARRVPNGDFREVGLLADGCKIMAGRRGCMVQLFAVHMTAYGCKQESAI